MTGENSSTHHGVHQRCLSRFLQGKHTGHTDRRLETRAEISADADRILGHSKQGAVNFFASVANSEKSSPFSMKISSLPAPLQSCAEWHPLPLPSLCLLQWSDSTRQCVSESSSHRAGWAADVRGQWCLREPLRVQLQEFVSVFLLR